ncbi:MAG: hypothetical protein QXL61_09110, partial [Archaeoglobaceae archaeon]
FQKTIPMAFFGSLVSFFLVFTFLPANLDIIVAVFLVLVLLIKIRRAAKISLEVFVLSSYIAILSLFFALILGIEGFVSALMSGILSGYTIQRLDSSYHRLKKVAKWFGV